MVCDRRNGGDLRKSISAYRDRYPWQWRVDPAVKIRKRALLGRFTTVNTIRRIVGGHFAVNSRPGTAVHGVVNRQAQPRPVARAVVRWGDASERALAAPSPVDRAGDAIGVGRYSALAANTFGGSGFRRLDQYWSVCLWAGGATWRNRHGGRWRHAVCRSGARADIVCRSVARNIVVSPAARPRPARARIVELCCSAPNRGGPSVENPLPQVCPDRDRFLLVRSVIRRYPGPWSTCRSASRSGPSARGSCPRAGVACSTPLEPPVRQRRLRHPVCDRTALGGSSGEVSSVGGVHADRSVRQRLLVS